MKSLLQRLAAGETLSQQEESVFWSEVAIAHEQVEKLKQNPEHQKLIGLIERKLSVSSPDRDPTQNRE